MSFYAQFAEYYTAIFPFSEAVYTFLRRWIHSSHQRCLDVGCGTGHYAGRLAEDGFDAVGIDLDPAMIAYARVHYPQAEFHVMDMRNIGSLTHPFDAGFCIGNTAAHLDRSQFAAFLETVAAMLRPSGPWILQVVNWEHVLQHERMSLPLIEAEDGGLVFEREYLDISERRVIFHTRLALGGETLFEDSVPLYPLRTDALIDLHRAVGFQLMEHVGSYAGDVFDPGVFSANILVFRR